MSDKIKMRNGDAILIMVKNGRVIHYSWNMLPHAEFVRRATGELPEGLGSARLPNWMARSRQSARSTSSGINFPLRPRLPRRSGKRSNKAKRLTGVNAGG